VSRPWLTLSGSSPDWRLWRPPSDMYYAGRPDTAQVIGEDPLDLRDQILGWIGRREGGS